MKSIIKIITAMIIWGSIGLFVKNISLPSIEIAFLRAIIASFYLIVVKILFFKDKSKKIHKNSKMDLILLIISGVIIAFNWLFLFQSYKYTSLANATLTYYTAPVFVVLLSPIVLKEKLSSKKIITVIIAMIGLILIISGGNSSSNVNNNNLLGFIYGMSAAILYASVILINKKIINFSGFDRTLIQLLVSGLALLPIVLYRNAIHISNHTSLIFILILGIVHTGIAYFLYFSSIEHVSVQKASLLSYFDPISAVIFGTVFLSEPLGFIQIIGGCLILFSTLIKD